jgi:hypothetical protein
VESTASTTESTAAMSTTSTEPAAVESSAPVRKATAMSTKVAVTAAKVRASEPIGATLAELPGRTRLAQASIGLSETMALSEIPLSDAVPYVTRREAARASLTEIAASEIALAKTLFNLPDRRALTNISSRTL